MQTSKVCKFRLHTFQSSVKSLFQTDLRRQLTKMGLPRMNHACLVNFLLQTSFALSFDGFPVFFFYFGDFALAPCETYNDKSINLISEAYLIHLLWLGCLVVLVLNRIIKTNERLRKNWNCEELPPFLWFIYISLAPKLLKDR